jgi:hypothetical protein
MRRRPFGQHRLFLRRAHGSRSLGVTPLARHRVRSSSATTFEMSPTGMHVVITYLDQVIEVWLVPLR